VRTDIGEIKLDMREPRARMGHVEHAVSTLSIRVDRLTDRVERMELPLGLVDSPSHETQSRPTPARETIDVSAGMKRLP